MYYKRIEKKDYFYKNAPIALEKSYKTLKSKKGVIASSDDNGEFLLVPTPMVDEFISVVISRADVKAIGYDADKISDSDMQYIADKVADALIEYGGYWDNLEGEVERNGGEKCHRIIDTSFGEVMVKPEKDDMGEDCLNVYIGDNWDDYVGTIYNCDFDADDDELITEIENLFEEE
jgi:hypothetical protein